MAAPKAPIPTPRSFFTSLQDRIKNVEQQIIGKWLVAGQWRWDADDDNSDLLLTDTAVNPVLTASVPRVQGWSQVSSGVATGTSTNLGPAVAFHAKANHTYKVEVQCIVTGSVAGNEARVYVFNPDGSMIITVSTTTIPVANYNCNGGGTVMITASDDEDTTWRLVLALAIGTGTVTSVAGTNPVTYVAMTVTDMGFAPSWVSRT